MRPVDLVTDFEGRWREPQGTPHGELVWLQPGKAGLQTHVATIAGKVVATARKNRNENSTT
ncbi:hypothetical protein ACFQAT_28490 [Undibacterium arcticum]|uniref:hypothetical protein n=1 Tax=Undibacterium arcticum TaxID=1762892 RepID=UPI00361A48EF